MTIGAGTARSELVFASPVAGATFRIRLKSPSGKTLATVTGVSPLVIERVLGAGTYAWEVRSSAAATYTLTVTHAAP
ncbi:MAG: hypothetical protein ACKOTZ_09840 [Chloroflexota bacterium]